MITKEDKLAIKDAVVEALSEFFGRRYSFTPENHAPFTKTDAVGKVVPSPKRVSPTQPTG
jgi:hypothetical protein